MPRAPSTSPPSRTAWIVVALLWVVGLLNYLDRNVIATLHEPIVADVPMTEAQFGLLTSIFLWVYGLASPACGFLADRFSRRRIICLSLLVWSTVMGLTSVAHSFAALFWSRALMGISEACFLPAALALVCDHHRGATRSRATAALNTGIYAGATLSGAGGYLAALGGWRTAYTLLGAVGVAYALVLILFLPGAPAVSGPEGAGPEGATDAGVKVPAALRALFGGPSFWILETLNALTSVTNWTIYAWLPAFLHERYHLGIGPAGLAATASLQIPSFGAVLLGGWWADQWSRRTPRGRMFVPALGFCLAAPGLWAVGWGGSLGLTLGGIALYGLGRGCYDANLMPLLRSLVDPRYSATGYGCLNSVACIAGGLMTLLGGVLRDRHLDLGLVFRACALGILATSALLVVLRPRRPETPAAPPAGPSVGPLLVP